VSDRREHVCPECGAPREPGGAPSCVCAQRAAEALRETRSAEAAEAEDFNPLRIRPYVDLGPGEGPVDADIDAVASRAPGKPGEPPEVSVSPHQPESPSPSSAPPATGTPADPATTSAVPTPLTQAVTRPDTADLRLFEAQAPGLFEARAPGPEPMTAFLPEEAEEPREPREPEEPRRRGGRRRRFALVTAAATAVVVAAAGFASGLFGYETPSRDRAYPDNTRASVPDTSESGPSSSPSESKSPSRPPASDTPPAPPAPSSPSASPSAAEPTAPATPSRTAPTTRAPSTEPPTDSAPPSGGGGEGRDGDPQELRLGDRGPEVTELQLRLSQLFLFSGGATGTYNSQTENSVEAYQLSRNVREELGVYGEETRRRLESETTEPQARNASTPDAP